MYGNCRFLGYGSLIEPLVGRLGDGLASAGAAAPDLAAVVFTHPPGHSAVPLESGGEKLLCVGDLFYDPLRLSNPGWCTPFPGLGTITRRGDAYKWAPLSQPLNQEPVT